MGKAQVRHCPACDSPFSIFKQPNDVIAPRNDVDTPSHSRGAMRPSFANKVRLLKSEGAGNAGRAMHPQPCVQK
jgi:hypothetical protein